MHVRRTLAAAVAAAALTTTAACRHAPAAGSSGIDLDRVRGHVAGCPIVLTDALLDDLSTYQSCTLPPDVARLVRNDYADPERHPPDLRRLDRNALAVSRATFEAQLDRFVDPAGVLRGTLWLDVAQDELHPDPVLAPGVTIPFLRDPDVAQACRGGCEGRLVTPPHPDRPFRPRRWAELRHGATPDRPLRGVRVGIDPGHAGGRYGSFEARHVTFEQQGRSRVIQEGDLTLRTALELRARLVALGASVTLTRDAPSLVHAEPLHDLRPAAEAILGRIVLDPAYANVEQRLASADRLRLRTALALFAVARRSRFESLLQRASLLDAASPDLVLSIHFNAYPPGSRRTEPQEVVTMVRGFHARERLYSPRDRWRAIEEAFAVADFDAAVHLGALCVRAMSQRLELPVARENRYADHLPVRDAAGRSVGVDAWDGALLRYLDGVGVLTEGPYVDAPDEARRLAEGLDTPLGTPGTRTERYADALASCVVDWVGRWVGSDRSAFAGDP